MSFTPINASMASPWAAGVGTEVLDELLAPLPAVDSAAEQSEGREQPVTPARRRLRPRTVTAGPRDPPCRATRRRPGNPRGRRQLHAAPRDLFRDSLEVEPRPQEGALDPGVEGHGARRSEHLPIQVEPDRRLVVRRRHEDAAAGVDAEPEHSGGIEIGEEDQGIVRRVVLLEVLDQRRAPRPLLLQPLLLVVRRVRVGEDPVGVRVEALDLPRAGVRESAHRHPADAIRPLRVLVGPGDVVAGAGRQHLHVMTGAEPLRDEPAVILGTAEDLRAVALNDEGDLQG